jgi:hypothetical protein
MTEYMKIVVKDENNVIVSVGESTVVFSVDEDDNITTNNEIPNEWELKEECVKAQIEYALEHPPDERDDDHLWSEPYTITLNMEDIKEMNEDF